MMNRFFTLLVAASCLTAVGQSEYCLDGTVWDDELGGCVPTDECTLTSDLDQNGLVGLSDLLVILGEYGLSFQDDDQDGVCDAFDECLDLQACNYLEDPTQPCLYVDVLGICGGQCVADEDFDGVCDDEDDCVGIVDECGICNGNGPSVAVIENVVILYDSVYAAPIDQWFVFEVGADTTFSFVCGVVEQVVTPLEVHECDQLPTLSEVMIFNLFEPGSPGEFDLVEGTLVSHDVGPSSANYVSLEMLIISSEDPSSGFYFSAEYSDWMTWNEWEANPGQESYYNTCELGDHETWDYTVMEQGEMIGFGVFENSHLILSHAPPNEFFGYQRGFGANQQNANFGFWGWFLVSGTLFLEGVEVTPWNPPELPSGTLWVEIQP